MMCQEGESGRVSLLVCATFTCCCSSWGSGFFKVLDAKLGCTNSVHVCTPKCLIGESIGENRNQSMREGERDAERSCGW